MAKRPARTSKPRRKAPPRRAPRRSRPPSIEDLAATLVREGDELFAIEDPLEAEAWTSHMLGSFYKLDVPLEARDDLAALLVPSIVLHAVRRADRGGLAILEALAALLDDEHDAALARNAAVRLVASGIERPSWAAELGRAAFEGAWVLEDVYGDQEGYFATFRYPGREPHIVNALYDKAMGEVIKDAFVGYAPDDVRALAGAEPGMSTRDVEPGPMARRVLDAIAMGDMFIDNAWTEDFKGFRLLLLSRMSQLPVAPEPDETEPLDDAARDVIIGDFLASGSVAAFDQAQLIASRCLDYLCDYRGDDPYRWSPTVVELFLLDYLPRKVALDLRAIDQVPAVLREWVRFALGRRGLEERWIVETQGAVDEFAKEFRAAMTDADNFGPAKQLVNEMLADGIDVSDQPSIQDWIDAYNERPVSERR